MRTGRSLPYGGVSVWEVSLSTKGCLWPHCYVIKDKHGGCCVMCEFIQKRIHLTHTSSWSLVNWRALLTNGGGLCPGDLSVRGTPPPEWGLQKEHGIRGKDPRKEHGTRQPDRKWHHTETPSPLWTDTGVKTLPCSKLRLREVINSGVLSFFWVFMSRWNSCSYWITNENTARMVT